jgi:hypothetical protein
MDLPSGTGGILLPNHNDDASLRTASTLPIFVMGGFSSCHFDSAAAVPVLHVISQLFI